MALDSPFLLVGTAAQAGAQIEDLRGRLAVFYLTVFNTRSSGFDEVVSNLAGR